jgi:hypothetical protein
MVLVNQTPYTFMCEKLCIEFVEMEQPQHHHSPVRPPARVRCAFFNQKNALEDAIGSHAVALLEALPCV